MRSSWLCALVFCVSSPAIGQSQPASSGLPNPDQLANRDTLTIGVGAAWLPDYEGSDDYRLVPAGAIRGKYHGISFSTNGTYLDVDLLPTNGKVTLDAGPIAGLRFDNRRDSRDPVVSLMKRRKTAIELGGFAGVSFHGIIDPYDTLSFHLDVLHDVAHAYNSTVYDPNISFSTPISTKTYVSLSAGAEIVGSKFADYYFGVTPADVVATHGALPLYDPDGGVKNLRASLLVNHSLSGNLLGGLSVFGVAQYSRLLGDFARSPIVAKRGSPNQLMAATGLAYTW